MRRMFSDIEADVYVLVDGDATYDAFSATAMIAKLIGKKLIWLSQADLTARGRLIAAAIASAICFARMFGSAFTDILSGYRVFSRRFVKSFPVLSGGFEIETELTVHALELELPVSELATPYLSRPSGSNCKLNTSHDGFRILWTIFELYRTERPLQFFGAAGLILAVMSVVLAIPIFATYLRRVWFRVSRLRYFILSLLAFLMGAVGLILDTATAAAAKPSVLLVLCYTHLLKMSANVTAIRRAAISFVLLGVLGKR